MRDQCADSRMITLGGRFGPKNQSDSGPVGVINTHETAFYIHEAK